MIHKAHGTQDTFTSRGREWNYENYSPHAPLTWRNHSNPVVVWTSSSCLQLYIRCLFLLDILRSNSLLMGYRLISSSKGKAGHSVSFKDHRTVLEGQNGYEHELPKRDTQFLASKTSALRLQLLRRMV